MFNKVVQVGLLDKDPELRYTPAGDASCNFTLATSEKFRSKDGQLQERIEWRSGGRKAVLHRDCCDQMQMLGVKGAA